jgi:predicted AlkP superfamily pyrophosphatase or phosphodiesterase
MMMLITSLMHTARFHHGREYRCLLVSLLFLLNTSVINADSAKPARSIQGNIKHVVIISVDGLRPDAITETNARHMSGLIGRGAYASTARTVQPSTTLPSHISMLTGLDTDRHGVTSNGELPGHIDFPTVFGQIRAAGGTTAMFFGKKRLRFIAQPNTVTRLYGPGVDDIRWHDASSTALAEAFARLWPRERYTLAFVHLRDPDLVGHKKGWMSPAYLKAVRTADSAVGSIVDTLIKEQVIEVTAIILTADHGGSGTSHWGKDPTHTTIPWVCAVPGMTTSTLIQNQSIRVFDTTPTVLDWFGLNPLVKLSGKAITACRARVSEN